MNAPILNASLLLVQSWVTRRVSIPGSSVATRDESTPPWACSPPIFTAPSSSASESRPWFWLHKSFRSWYKDGMKLKILLASAALAASACSPAIAAESVVAAPAAARTAHEGSGLKTAIFAGGCFWGVEAVFSHVKGVKSAVSGYHGGSKADADYETVSSGRTGHRESVKVTYDPKVVRYDQLLRMFFSVVADPDAEERAGPRPWAAVQRRARAAEQGAARSRRRLSRADAGAAANGSARSSPGSPRPAPSTRPKTITRTSPTRTPTRAISAPGTCPRSQR